MLAGDLVPLGSLGLGPDGESPVEVRFETNDPVDDLALVLGQARVLVQAKNTISLSADPSSELAKVMRQVVTAFLEKRPGDRYLLAVSPETSRKIQVELKKICEAHRLNESGAAASPLTQSERRTRDVARAHVVREYEAATRRVVEHSTVDDILRTLHVETFDVSESGSLERLAVTALTNVAISEPRALWRSLIATSLHLARERGSLDAAGLRARFDRHLRAPATDERSLPEDSGVSVELSGSASMGKDVVLAVDEKGTTFLAELRRFNVDSTRCVRFTQGAVEFPDGRRSNLLRRTATYEGMIRELESGLLDQVTGDVVLVETDLGDTESEPPVVTHRAAYERALLNRDDVLSCLVCGRAVSENLAYSIEIDDEDSPYQVGIVHKLCLRPVYRVVGVIKDDRFDKVPSLRDFDFGGWIRSLRGGQGLWNSLRSSPPRYTATIGWNSRNTAATTGGWGVRYETEDGTSWYVLLRGRVQRFRLEEARGLVTEFVEALEHAAERGDPLVVGTGGVGPRSKIMSASDPSPPRIRSYDVAELTAATVDAYSVNENYYAPVFWVGDPSTGDPFDIGGAHVLLTDPLQFEALSANWRNGGIDLPQNFTTSILSSDRDFDLFVSRAFESGHGVVVDPVLGPDGGLIGGYPVGDFHQVLAARRRE